MSAAANEVVEPEVIPDGLPEILYPIAHLLGPDGYVAEKDAALLPFQCAWVYDRAKLKVAVKSRRIGFTWATAYEAVEVAAQRKANGGMDVWYMANAADDAQDFIADCAKWVRWLMPIIGEIAKTEPYEELVKDGDKSILAYTIRFSSGFRIRALTSKPRRLRGKQGYAILDEAAHHDDLSEWMKAASAFIVRGGRVAVISTYNGVENEFYELVESVRTGKRKRASLHEVDIHSAIRQGVYKRICQADMHIPWALESEADWLADLRDIHTEDAFAEEFECVPTAGGGAYIPKHIIIPRMRLGPDVCPVVEFKPSIHLDKATWGKAETWDLVPLEQRNREMRRWLDSVVLGAVREIADVDLYGGVDFGRTANLTVLTLLELRKDMTRRARLIIEMDNVPFEQQNQILDYVWARCKSIRKVLLDAGGLGRDASEHARDQLGHRAELISFTVPWYAAHWPCVKKVFEDGAIELPNYAPLLHDLASLRRVGGKVEIVGDGKSRAKKQQRHGDGAISLLLAEAAVGTKAESAATSPAERWGTSKKRKR